MLPVFITMIQISKNDFQNCPWANYVVKPLWLESESTETPNVCEKRTIWTLVISCHRFSHLPIGGQLWPIKLVQHSCTDKITMGIWCRWKKCMPLRLGNIRLEVRPLIFFIRKTLNSGNCILCEWGGFRRRCYFKDNTLLPSFKKNSHWWSYYARNGW